MLDVDKFWFCQFLSARFLEVNDVQCFVEKMNFQASMHQTEKTLKYAIRQKGPHPPNSSLKQAAQKQLTTKKRREGRGVKKGMHFMFLAWIFSTKHSILFSKHELQSFVKKKDSR